MQAGHRPPCPKNVPEGGGCQQLGRPAVVVHVGHGTGGVLHLVVHDGVDEHRDAVLGQDLKMKEQYENVYYTPIGIGWGSKRNGKY